MKTWKVRIFHVLIKIFNFTHRVLKFLGWEIVPLTVDNVLQPLTPAEKAEALTTDFLVPLKLAFEGLNSYKDITGQQRFFALNKYRQYAKTRAAVKDGVKKNPDILKTPIDDAIVIIGLPRSGTTMLQRLLACDPRLFSPMTWEMFAPLPPGRPQNWRDCERYKKIQSQLDIMALLINEFLPLHEFRAHLPEECLFIVNSYFFQLEDAAHPSMKKLWEFLMNSPADYIRDMYDFYRKALKCIFYKNLGDDKKLLLKCPIHNLNLNLYREAMPKAKFIFTYRNVRPMISSACSLFEKSVEEAKFPVDKNFIGKVILDLFKYSSRRGIATFTDIPKDSLICLGYSELVSNPLDVIKKIYTHFEMDLPPEVLAKMQRHLEANTQHKYGKHQYGSVSDYGITEDDIRKAMPEFFDYFKDSPEKLL